jgi:N-acetyl-anhydromuramyl-L-alanine amidase AmpD
MARPDYGRARWYGAYGGNYTNASRGRAQISRVIVHVTQGSFSSAVNWFKDSRAGVSAHYTVRSNDGFVGQSVQEEDIAYHAGNWTYNKTSVGIEHEGYVGNSSWFTGDMYRSSARLTAYLCDKYNIPIDRQHIIGHNQVPGATHTDPGRYWDWPRYIRLVRGYASDSTYKQVVDNASRRFRATSDWGTSTYSSQKAGKDYRFIRPKSGPGSAKFLVRFPSKGRYAIYARWPADPGYNARARFLIKTTSGWKVSIRNQRKNGGRWVRLGVFTMPRGDGSFVRLAKRSTSRGYIIADAVLVKKV